MSVIKEGHFTRSAMEEVDEAEIFEGDENTIVMTQTYTHEFQCEYKLNQYPFDTQVDIFESFSIYLCHSGVCHQNECCKPDS